MASMGCSRAAEPLVPDAVPPSTLEAVVFDVDGTLYRQRPLRRAMALRLLGAHALRPLAGLSTLRILSAYRRAQEILRDGPADGDLAGAQLRFAVEQTGAGAEQVQACVARWMERSPLDLLGRYAQPGIAGFVRGLRARGLKLGVLSDYPAEAKLEALGLAGLFDVVLCAQDPRVGVFKPNPRGILAVLALLGVEPRRALYIGDRAEVDAAAARAAGVASAILSPHERADGYLPFNAYDELEQRLFPPTALLTKADAPLGAPIR
jgi:HAD superfamily hydrolase (TIGR01549 family)